jgi:hypothetical protein
MKEREYVMWLIGAYPPGARLPFNVTPEVDHGDD